MSVRFILLSVVTVASVFFCSPSFAATDPCALFTYLQKNRSDMSVKHVRILGLNDRNIVGVMVLGLPRSMRITVNGIDITQYKTHSEQIICAQGAVGYLMSFDAGRVQADAAVIEVTADRVSASSSVTFRK